MTTLAIPSLERRLLWMVKEEVTAEPIRQWPSQSLELCLYLLRKVRQLAVERHQALEEVLAEGAEARSFVRGYSPFLLAADDRIAIIQELLEEFSAAEDAASQNLAAELRLLGQAEKAFRDFLAEALAQAAEPSRPVDWRRIQAAEEARGRGEMKPFLRR